MVFLVDFLALTATLWRHISILFLTLFIPLGSLVFGQRVIVYGDPIPEENQPGRFELVPETENEQQASQRLFFEPSLQPEDSQAVRGSGFAVPRIRGHDPAMVAAYLEDIPLQDSYTGVAVTYDFDLRASGGLSFYQGLGPTALPGVNGVGTMHYKLIGVGEEPHQVGLSSGKPYGFGPWLRVDHAANTGEFRWLTRMFVRHHQSQGGFSYFDNNQTPYNHHEHRLSWRENNDQRSWQAVPVVFLNRGDTYWRLVGWKLKKEAGVPTATQRLGSYTRQTTTVSFIDLVHGHLTAGPFGSEASLALHHRRDLVALDDPLRQFFALSESSKLEMTSDHIRLNLKKVASHYEWYYQLKPHQSTIELNNANATMISLKRKGVDQYFGTKVYFDSGIYFLAQLDYRFALGNERAQTWRFSDQVQSKPQRFHHRGAATELGYEFSGDSRTYLQAAVIDRPPSLFESFGDGATVQSSHDLAPERLVHLELGGLHHISRRLSLSGLVYFDRVKDKIVLVPASLGEALRAANVRDTNTVGQEINVHWQDGAWKARLGMSHIDARNITQRGEERMIPGVAPHVAVADIAWSQKRWQIRFLSRYRSLLYRDLGNRQAIAASWTHDLNLDWSNKQPSHLREQRDLPTATTPRETGSYWQLGVSLRNITDTSQLKLPRDSNGVRGYGPYSEVRGQPLPGRQWLVHVARHF